MNNNQKNFDFSLTTITFGELMLWNHFKKLDLNHPTQRNSVWSISDATKLIESVVDNFPFQPIYIIKNKNYFSVIDGKQRITSLFAFIGQLDESIIFDKKTKNIKNNFELDLSDLSDEFKEKWKISEEDKLNFEVLSSKLSRFESILTNLTFPCYLSYQENSEQGEEQNAYDLFSRINSTGVSIEEGEIIQALILEKIMDRNNKDKNTDIIKIIKQFENLLVDEEKKLPRKRVWYLFARMIYIDSNKNDFLNGKLDGINNIEENVIEFIKNIDDLSKRISNLEKLVNKFDRIYKEKGINNNFSFFNKKSSKKTTPVNFYIYSILSKDIINENVSSKTLKNVKKVCDEILNNNEIFMYEYDQEIEGQTIKREINIFKKFSREPQKIKLSLFIYNELKEYEGLVTDEKLEDIRNSIVKEFIEK